MTTVREVYLEIAERFQSESHLDRAEALAQARLLVDHITGTRYAHLLKPRAEVGPDAQRWLDEAVADVLRGRPLPYITGEREFFGLLFHCDERALVPRPETEVMVEAAIAWLANHATPIVTDLGTGTGCIAISMAHALPGAMVYATDMEAGALELAHENAERLGVVERIHFLPGVRDDWAAPLQGVGLAGHLDAILSNPPYIATNKIPDLQPQIRDWEPRAALDGGGDGLDAYRALAAQCGDLLAPDGFLMAELGAEQDGAAKVIFESAGWQVEAILPDGANIGRVLVARRIER